MTTNQPEHRKYVRLKGSFPVRFTIVRLQSDFPGLDWEEGFTRNVSKEGMCLETNALRETTIKYLEKENIYLDVHIKVALASAPVKAVADVVWYKKSDQNSNQFLIGLKFRKIAAQDLRRILKHAQWSSRVPKIAIVISALIVLAIIFGILT